MEESDPVPVPPVSDADVPPVPSDVLWEHSVPAVGDAAMSMVGQHVDECYIVAVR